MTAVIAILVRFGPYIVALAIGIFGGYKLEEGRYAAEKAARVQDQLAYSQARETAQKAANDALQKQIQARLDAENHNGQILSQLAQERDSAVSARTLAERLLAAAQARPHAGAGPVPTADHQPGAPGASQGGGDQSITDILAAAAADCRDAIQRFAALQQQIIPQLSR